MTLGAVDIGSSVCCRIDRFLELGSRGDTSIQDWETSIDGAGSNWGRLIELGGQIHVVVKTIWSLIGQKPAPDYKIIVDGVERVFAAQGSVNVPN